MAVLEDPDNPPLQGDEGDQAANAAPQNQGGDPGGGEGSSQEQDTSPQQPPPSLQGLLEYPP